MMKKVIRLTENDLRKIVKRVIKEQTNPVKTVSGPYKPINEAGNDLYIVKLEQSMCRDDRRELTKFTLSPMTGTTCPQEFVSIPGNKFYVYWLSNNGIRMFTPEHQSYFLGTNNGQGYNTEEEAKKAVSKIINPQGLVGRQVRNIPQNGSNYKVVSKYDKQGNLIKVKTTSKDSDTTTPGNQRYKQTQKTGL